MRDRGKREKASSIVARYSYQDLVHFGVVVQQAKNSLYSQSYCIFSYNFDRRGIPTSLQIELTHKSRQNKFQNGIVECLRRREDASDSVLESITIDQSALVEIRRNFAI